MRIACRRSSPISSSPSCLSNPPPPPRRLSSLAGSPASTSAPAATTSASRRPGDDERAHKQEKQVRVAIYATAGEALADLTAYTARRGWEVALECVDQSPGPQGSTKGIR